MALPRDQTLRHDEPPAAGTTALRIYGVSSLSLERYAFTACVCGSRHTAMTSSKIALDMRCCLFARRTSDVTRHRRRRRAGPPAPLDAGVSEVCHCVVGNTVHVSR